MSQFKVSRCNGLSKAIRIAVKEEMGLIPGI